jgi:urease accessory protein
VVFGGEVEQGSSRSGQVGRVVACPPCPIGGDLVQQRSEPGERGVRGERVQAQQADRGGGRSGDGVMERDARARRGDLPVLFTSLTEDPAATDVAAWVRERLAVATR